MESTAGYIDEVQLCIERGTRDKGALPTSVPALSTCLFIAHGISVRENVVGWDDGRGCMLYIGRAQRFNEVPMCTEIRTRTVSIEYECTDGL